MAQSKNTKAKVKISSRVVEKTQVTVVDSTAEVPTTVDTAPQQDQVTVAYHFPTPIYLIEKPEFLATARQVSREFIARRKKDVDLDPIYPVYMTEALNTDPRMLDFANYVAQTAWNLLGEQGYDMNNYSTFFTEMWCQEHHRHSMMEQHVHGYGAQMAGFYFLDSPEDCSRVVFHDPKPGKVQLNLPERDMSAATVASNLINFEAKPGTLIITNAWLAHSFTRNAAVKPMRFIHFNIGVQPVPQQFCPTAGADNAAPTAEIV
jgi:uncharacterized protein (TIGR02466 family)